MSLALISLSKDAADDSGPVGLLPLFDGYVLDQQVRAAIEAGAEQLILICPTMNGAVLQYVDQMRGTDVDIQLVRSGKDLVKFAETDSEILFLSDGILPDAASAEQLADVDDETILVVDNADEYEDFERIDLNHRWVGIAKLNASRLSEFIDLPGDWDVGSALLRGAVQSECKRQLVTDTDISNGAISHLASGSAVSGYSRDKLREAHHKKGNFLQRLVVWPVSRALLPKLWKIPNARNYLAWSASAAGAIAATLTYFDVSITAVFALLIIGTILLGIRNYVQTYSNDSKRLDAMTIAGNLLISVIILLIIVRESSPATMIPNLVIFALSLGLLVLAHHIEGRSRWDWIKPDAILVLLILLCFSIFGSFFAGLYWSALLGILYMLGVSLMHRHNMQISRNSAK